jgi:RNA polymerase sigma factor (sigma-70 family)
VSDNETHERERTGELPAVWDRARADRFRLLYEAHHTPVLRYARRRCALGLSAEDVAADVFLVAWRRLDELPADALPWLYGTARGVILNQRRGTRRHAALVELARNDAEVAMQQTPTSDGEILLAIARLSELDREALLLVAWEGLDRRRAARAMGCSTAAFAARLHRARRRLAAELERPLGMDMSHAVLVSEEL